jgi:hypothetical protein
VREERRRRAHVSAAVAAILLAGNAGGANEAPNVRLGNSVHRSALARALANAARLLGQPSCEGLVDEFADQSGRPLRASLEASGRSAAQYLDTLFFYDASERLCAGSALAVTRPGHKVVLVCGSTFLRQFSQNSQYAEAVLIHEALHSLGLGENPPSGDIITRRVLARCPGRTSSGMDKGEPRQHASQPRASGTQPGRDELPRRGDLLQRSDRAVGADHELARAARPARARRGTSP